MAEMDIIPLDDLPLVVYEVLFDHLHLIDLARLKRVCKKLHYLVQKYRIKELIIHTNDNCLDILTHFDDGRYQNSCIIKPRKLERMLPFRIRTRPTESSLFHPHRFLPADPTVRHFSTYTIFLRSGQFNAQFLKSLTCCFTQWDGSNNLTFDEINKLSLLERLEIYFERYSKSFSSHGQLSLPNLKTLVLKSKADYHFTIQVEAPRCEGFHLCSTDERFGSTNYNERLRVQFSDPSLVKYLSLGSYHESSNVFKNIEFLQAHGGANLMDSRFFATFPRLKTLKILQHNSLEGLKQLFRLCKHHNVKLVFHGIHLVDDNQLDTFEETDLQTAFRYWETPGSDQMFNRLIDNYDRLDEDLNFISRIEFSERIARLLETDAERFLGKFHNLCEIISTIKIENPKLFFRLLSSQGNLIYLWILNSGMSQQWFDQLANIPTLTKLHIEEKKNIKLWFASKLPILSWLTINHHIDLREDLKLDELESWRSTSLYITVKKGENSLHINKYLNEGEYDGNRYKYILYKDTKKNEKPKNEYFLDLEDLVRRNEEIRNEENPLSHLV